MSNENSFPETHSYQNTFVDLVEQSQLNLNPGLSLSSSHELEYFNQNYLEPDVLEYPINPLQANQEETDVLTGLNLLEPSGIGQPDIIVGGLTLSSSIRAGSNVSISYTLQNIGNALASSSQTKYYLSSDTTFDSNDLLLGDDTPASLSAGASQSRSDSVTFSGNLSIGSYYFLVVADSNNTNLESNETNNIFSKSLQITKPDLVIESYSLTVPGSLVAGQAVKFNYTIKNQGDASAVSSTTQYYLSTDINLDSKDIYLGNDTIATIAAGTSLTRYDSVTLSSMLNPGTYYLLTQVDASNTCIESNQANNIFAKTIDLQGAPDLILNTSNIASSLAAGNPISVNYTIQNIGPSTAGTSRTRFYLSTNTTYDSTDISLGLDNVGAIASGASISKVKTFTISYFAPTGSYYLLARADITNTVKESNETNNIFSSPETIEITKPDLEITQFNVSVPNEPTVGSLVNVSYTIANKGKSAAKASITKYYLSSDGIFDANDSYLGDDSISTLGAGATLDRTDSFVLNTSLGNGIYYFLAITDSTNVVAESNENNNLINQIITLNDVDKPDLIIDFPVGSLVVNQGSNLNLSYTIKNQGSVAAQASTTKFYLSIDTTLDNNDIFLFSNAVAALANNATSSENTNLTIGNSINVGTYYLLAQADSEAVIDESNENNNLSYQTIQITEAGTPDLIINPLSITVNGLNLSVSYTIKNQGSLGSGASHTKFYLSSNNILEATDPLLGTDAVVALGFATSSVKSVALQLADNLNAGTYYILAQADSDGAIAESNETNNIANATISLKSDLIISNLSVSNGTNKVTQGFGFTPTYTLKNQGNAIAGTSVTKYVVSKDAILGNADDFAPTILSNGGADAGLTAGATRVENNDYLAIYGNITPGMYNFFAIADSTNTVPENNENNNPISIFIDFTVPPKPDLIVEKLTLQSSANVGSYLNLSSTIRNIDTGYAGYSNLAFYLSTDNVVDASDFAMDYHLVSGSTPYDVPISRSRSLFLDPLKVKAGTYNLIAKVDPNNRIIESNESNNTWISSITINPLLKPDLSITNVSLSSFEKDNTSGKPILKPGSLITLPYTISNSGGAIAPSQTNFYLSTDPVYNSTDILLGSHSTLALDAGFSKELSANISLNHSGIALGINTYYLIAIADAGLVTTVESNETNNIKVTQVIINNSGTTNFTNNNGYGLINAAAAVAASVGVSPFADVPNVDPNWGVDLIKAPEVWNAGYTGQGITVAVIDTGVDYNHPDLMNNIWINTDEIAGNGIDDDGNGYVDDVRGWDFVDNDNSPLGTNGHGTHVAGIIAANRNDIGRTGVANGAKIMPLKVLGGGDQWSNVSNAIRYAVDNGARVINMSLGGSTSDLDGRLKESLQYASEHDVIVVSAAGNDGGSNPITPASYSTQWGLAVGAATNTGALAGYSNKAGFQPQIAYVTAPGTSTSTLPNNKYGTMSGTSMATPHVTGVVALMLSANPNLTDADVRQILTQTAITGTISFTSITLSDLENPITSTDILQLKEY